MAKIFDLRAVAEGIENTHQLRYAKDCGCTGFQGYFLDKPMRVHVWREKLLSEKECTFSENVQGRLAKLAPLTCTFSENDGRHYIFSRNLKQDSINLSFRSRHFGSLAI